MSKKDVERKRGFSFGLTSAIITTLGMIVGLDSATQTKGIIIAGILSVGIADALSDSFSMHVSEEASAGKSLWRASFYAFMTKAVFAMIFLIPFLLFSLKTAVYISVGYGLILVTFYSYVAVEKNKWKAALEHLAISLLVILATSFVGKLIAYF